MKNFIIKTSMKAGASQCTLANLTQAKTACENGELGQWDILKIAGAPGQVQMGPGYGCEQKIEKNSVIYGLCV